MLASRINPLPDLMLKLLKFTPLIVCLSLTAACTPIPERSRANITPRPVAPLPVETLSPLAPLSSPTGTGKPAKSSKPSKTKGQPPALSANEVKIRLQQAEDKAVSAANLQQSAQTKEDWGLVLNQLQQAIALLKQIPSASPQRAIVQQRLATYQSNLAQVKQLSVAPPAATSSSNLRRRDGIPLIILPDASPSPSSSPSPTASPSPTNSPK